NRQAFGQVLRMKGRVLDAMTETGQAARRSGSDTSAQLERLVTVRTAHASAAAQGLDPAKMKRLEAEAATLDAKISESSEEFRAATQPVNVDTIQRALPEGSALVEIVSFH